jgi:ABC-type sugar transport system ATPase subunit
MAGARLQGIGKRYSGSALALRDFELELREGEFMVLVGPSGCGKSTALRIFAGLEAPDSGRVWIGEHDVTGWAPGERDVAMVFQSYALYPHKSVRENLGFGLRMRGVDRAEIERRTTEIAERLSLQALLDRRPAQLSGGQRQRVALGRALVRRPQLFLLDEPLSNLDAKLRLQMRAELSRLHLAFGTTTLYVTHDQEEAMTLGQRIAVLSTGGRIEQVGTPTEVYGAPASVFVADFIGTPSINWWEGELVARDGGHVVRCEEFELPLSAAATDAHTQLGPVTIGIRPHDLTIGEARPGAIAAQVELVEVLGAALLLHVRGADNADIRVLCAADAKVRSGDRIALHPAPGRVHLFDQAGVRLTAAHIRAR